MGWNFISDFNQGLEIIAGFAYGMYDEPAWVVIMTLHRRGFRDPYTSILVYAHKTEGDYRIWAPLFCAGDEVRGELQFLNELRDQSPEYIAKKPFARRQSEYDIRPQQYRAYCQSAKRSGYLDGLDKAGEMTVRYANSMYMRESRHSVMRLAIRLIRFRRGLDVSSYGCTQVLRKGKLVL